MRSQVRGHSPVANCQESGAFCFTQGLILVFQETGNKKPLTPDRERSDQPNS